jgi:hypothetical protein
MPYELIGAHWGLGVDLAPFSPAADLVRPVSSLQIYRIAGDLLMELGLSPVPWLQSGKTWFAMFRRVEP